MLRESSKREFQASPMSEHGNSDMTDPVDDNIFGKAVEDEIFPSAYKGGETSFSQMTMNLAT